MKSLIGKMVGRYEIVEALGQGGFGQVYRAIQHPVMREVALKIILPQYANQSDFVKRFQEEASIHARLEHDHIVRLYDFWRDSEGTYLVMQYIRGQSLQNLIAQGPLSPDDTLRIVAEIASALTFAHLGGIIHHDLKPSNILLGAEGRAYLTDFGIARDYRCRNGASQSRSGILGSPTYMSPEQIRGAATTSLSDIYSLAITTYEMLTGQPPFKGTLNEVLIGHTQKPLPPLDPLNFPHKVYETLKIATSKDPLDRYQEARKFVQALEEAFDRTQLSAVGATRPVRIDDTRPDIPNPYRGLRTFEEADAQNFCGRSNLVARLAARLAENHPFARFLAVIGPSGSGKSSLVRAGLIPGLRNNVLPNSAKWYRLTMTPGPQPYAQLAAVLQTLAIGPLPNLQEILQDRDQGLLDVMQVLLPSPEAELFLFIDQFEEVFTLAKDHESIHRFLNLIYTSVTHPQSRLRVVIALRADFYDRPLLYDCFNQLIRERSETVIPMTRAELEDAIVLPPKKLKVHVESALVQAMIQDVQSQPGGLPLLEYTLAEMFEARSGNVLTFESYHRLGGVRGAISRRADEVYHQLTPEQQAVAHQAFLRLVNPGEGVEDTRRRLTQSELLSIGGLQALAVMEHFERARLITTDYDPITREPTLEVAHEALIREWATLRRWLSEKRNDLRRHRDLMAQTKQWAEAGFDPSYLMRGSRLVSFSEWRQTTSIRLSRDEESFLDTCLKARDAEAQKLARDAIREKRLARLLRLRMRTIIILLALGILASLIFIQQIEAERKVAEQERLIAQAERDLSRQQVSEIFSLNQALSALRSFEEGRFFLAMAQAALANTTHDPPVLAQRVLAEVLSQRGARRTLEGHEGRVWSVAYSSDGRLIASGGQDSTIRLWNAQTGQLLSFFKVPEGGRIYDLKFFPDGQRLASVFDNGWIMIWKVDGQTLDLHRQWRSGDDGLWNIAITPDGRRLLTAAEKRGAERANLKIWDAESSDMLACLSEHTDSIIALTLSADGRLVASAGEDEIIRLWDLETQTLLAELKDHETIIASLAFSTDGQTLYSGDADSKIIAWDVVNRRRLYVLNEDKRGHTSGAIRTLAIDSENGWLYSGAYDGNLSVWDLKTRSLAQVLAGHEGWVLDSALSADKRHLVTASADGVIILWDILGGGDQIQRLNLRVPAPEALAYAPSLQQVVVGHQDGTLSAYDAGSSQPRWQAAVGAPILSLAYSPDGQWLAVGQRDGRISLRRSEDGAQGHTLRSDAPIRALAFHPAGEFLASVSGEFLPGGNRSPVRRVSVWQVTDGRLYAQHTQHDSVPRALIYDRYGDTLYSADADGLVFAWRWREDASAQLVADYKSSVNALAIDDSGKTLAIGGLGGSILLVNRINSEQMMTLQGPNTSIRDLHFVGDDHLLSAGGDIADGPTNVLYWSVRRRDVVREFRGHASFVHALALTQDRTSFYSLGEDGLLIRWRLDSLSHLIDRLFDQADVHCLKRDEAAITDPRCTSVVYLVDKQQAPQRYVSVQHDEAQLADNPHETCQTPHPERSAFEALVQIPRIPNKDARVSRRRKPRLGFSAVQRADWLRQAQQALPAEYTLLTHDAVDLDAQVEQIQRWLAQDSLDALIVAPPDDDSRLLDDVLRQARARHLPVLLVGGNQPDERVTSVVGVNPYDYGCLMMQAMVGMTDGEAILTRLHGSRVRSSQQIAAGLTYALTFYPQLNMINAVFFSSAEELGNGIRASLGAYSRLDGLFVDDSSTANQLLDLLEQRYPAWPRPIIVGVNDLATAQRAEALGMSVVSLVSEPLGRLAVQTAEALLHGEAIRVFTSARLYSHDSAERLQVWLETSDGRQQLSVP
ncbi:MAG: protein kinase [Anaerolineae bacterium]|nr:protein kinase [Anaerolineae bacterium]MDW8171695.1 protein kinase [Anaerolineae bacterium]